MKTPFHYSITTQMLYNVITMLYSLSGDLDMVTINMRIDENLKKESDKIFDELGLTMSAAMTIFLKAVVRNNGIPFSLEIPNKETLKAFKEVDDIVSGKKTSKKYKSTSDLRKDLGI